jgi:hypothetical protein
MNTSPVQALLAAVRRRLWLAQFAAALRVALWAGAALVLLALAVQLAGFAVPLRVPAFALGALWAAALIWASAQRPEDAACALWADRHLGGASAYTTLHEAKTAPPAAANAQALRWLEQWAVQRVPDGLRRLSEQRWPTRLLRPLLTLLVCSALAAVVLTLHQPEPASAATRVQAASSPVGVGDAPTPVGQAPESAPLVSEIANALRAAELREAAARGGAGDAPSNHPAKTGEDVSPPTAAPAGTSTADPAAGGQTAAARAVDAPPNSGTGRTSGNGTGREAGSSRDARADVGVSPVLRGAIPVQRSDPRGRSSSPDRQADMDRLAAYDNDPSTPGNPTMHAGPQPAAATPPPATDTTRLTATEQNYVQAWMKASGRRR